MSTILYSEGKMDVETYAQRIHGLLQLSYGNEELASILLDIVEVLLDTQYIRQLELPTIRVLSDDYINYRKLSNLQFGME